MIYVELLLPETHIDKWPWPVTFEDTGDPFDFQPVTDAQESAAGEARHKTIGGRGVVGRLIDKARKVTT